MGVRSNIFVTIARHGNNQPVWMISVEEQKQHLHFSHPRPTPHAPQHTFAIPNQAGTHSLHTLPATDVVIIGAIQIAEDAHASSADVHNLLQERMDFGEPLDQHALSEATAHDHWIRHALRELQKEKTVEHFDIDEFMTFARDYAAGRSGGQGLDKVSYSPVEVGKKAKSGFWLSYPTATSNMRREPESRLYGGLM